MSIARVPAGIAVEARTSPESNVAPRPILARASFVARWRTMARVGLRMALHDRAKFAAALIGVVFAVLLSGQQAATFLAIVKRNVMVVDNNPDVDIWVMPPETEILQPGKLMSQAPLDQARGTPGVAWAEPILIGGATVSRPAGGSEQAVIIGTLGPAWKGGPFNSPDLRGAGRRPCSRSSDASSRRRPVSFACSTAMSAG